MGIKPLPNLETRFVAANTLLRLDKPNQLSLGQTGAVIRLEQKLNENRERHFHATSRQHKLEYRRQDARLRKELATKLRNSLTSAAADQVAHWDPYDQNGVADWFDAEYMFGLAHGFDVVIGNPPYIQLQKGGGKLGNLYKDAGYATFARTGDIYQLFYEKGVNLLIEKGHLCYITSNKWMRAGYGNRLRKFFSEKINTKTLLDFGGFQVFESSTVDTNILLIEKAPPRQQLQATHFKSDFKAGDSIGRYANQNVVHLPRLGNDTWFIASKAEINLKEKIERIGKPLKEWDILIYRIVQPVEGSKLLDDETSIKEFSLNSSSVVVKGINNNVLHSALAENTHIAYEKGWSRFIDFCEEAEIADALSASPDAVSRFLVHLATNPSTLSGTMLSMGTVTLYKSAINRKFAEAGRSSPTNHPLVRATVKGLARLKGTACRRVEALREYHIKAMLSHCPDTTIGQRDAAIIAIGFAGALRRSEICNLIVGDVEFLKPENGSNRHMFLTIRRSKTDQQGRGQRIAILDGSVIRPIHRLQMWLQASRITAGPLFQSMKRGGHVQGKPLHHSDIPRIVKHYASRIGLNPKDVAGHSLRAGFVTSAAVHHARLDKIMAVTRHTNPATVMQYIRDADSFSDHAGEHFL